MVVVIKKKGESKDTIFRKFSRIFFEENIIEEVKEKQFYKKPSLLRKEKEKTRLTPKKSTTLTKSDFDKKIFTLEKNHD